MGEWEPGNMWEDYDQDFDQEEGEFEVQGTLAHYTDKAYLVDVAGQKDGVWLPKSQVGDIDGELNEGEPLIGEQYTFTIPAWLAEKKGL